MAEASPAEGDAAAGPGSGYMRQLCHELRQPLVVAVGYISMLEDGSFGELPAEAGKVLQTIAERLDAMNAIIEGMAGGGGQLDGG
jgi:signal transduction histidine kinase